MNIEIQRLAKRIESIKIELKRHKDHIKALNQEKVQVESQILRLSGVKPEELGDIGAVVCYLENGKKCKICPKQKVKRLGPKARDKEIRDLLYKAGIPNPSEALEAIRKRQKENVTTGQSVTIG